MKGGDTLSTTAISVRGAVRNIGEKRLAEIFEKNPYMAKIYPTEKAGRLWKCFSSTKVRENISTLPSFRPIARAFPSAGERVQENRLYALFLRNVSAARAAGGVCPVNCISSTIPRSIDTAHCLHCGNCLSICPVGAVERVGAAS